MSNEMKDWMNDTVEENRKLCELYPFLDCDHTYEFTWLDFVPTGWQESFLSMCQKLVPFKEDFEIFEIFGGKFSYFAKLHYFCILKAGKAAFPPIKK